MDVVASMSNDSRETLWIDDTSGGQTISLVNGCAIGSFDFKTDPYLPDSVYVKAGNFIAFNDKYNRTRLYTIMTVEGDDELDVHCEDIGLDLINEMANAWNFETDQTLDFYLNQVFGNSSWKVVYEASGLSTQTRHLKFDNNTDTKLSRLESIMSGFGFEGDFQITMEYMSVKTMEFHVYKTLGNKTEYDINKIYIDSINLISLNRSESIDDLYTAVLPTGGQVAGKALDISSIVYDDGQFWTTKGDNKLYDRLAAQKWSRFAGTSAQDKTKDPAYIYGHYSSNTTAVGTLFDEALANLKEHHDVKLAYEAKLLDLDSDLGDWIKIVDHAKQQDVYLKARIQEVTNHYTVSGEDEGKLANYKLLSTANGDAIRNLLNQIQEKVSKVTVSDLYFTIDDQGSYAPIKAEWSVNQPDIPEGKFLWIKTVDKYSDGTERVTYTVTKNKIDYHGPATVVSRVPVYFLSTSQYSAIKEDGSAPEKSDWTTIQPAYKNDRFFWKREIVTWSDGSVDYTFETYDQQMTEAYKKLADANKDILNLQDQVDGLIESWSADPVPTLKNYPANEWKTDADKKNHIGDLYYDKSNKCYRFMQNSDGSFAWKLIADTDVTKAIADAQKALDATDQSVTSLTTEYYASTSATELEGGTWSENRPEWTNSNYIWSRTKTTTKAGIITYSNPSCIQGNSGTNGKDGISPTVDISKSDGSTTITITDKNGTHSQVVKDGVNGTPGATGADGKTSYFHVKYSNDGGKTFTPNNGEEIGTYIGTYSDFKIEDSTSVSAYTWAKIKGEQGVPGKDGLNGTNGKTSYFHIKYSSVANPTSSSQMTETPNTYIGTYVDYVEADSSDPSEYTWSRFQGIQGDKGIPGTNGTNGKTSYLHIAYADSADGKTGFDVSNSANKLYIGQYTDFNPTDSTDHTKYSWTKIKGEQGAKGNDGTSVKITDKSVTYQASTSGTTTPTGAWVANPPTVAKGQYLWTKTVVTYSDGNSTTAYSVAYQGTNGSNGQNGSPGRGVKSTEVTYQIWKDGTSTPNGTWQTTVPDTTADKPYLWTRTIITYTDDTKSTSYSVGSTLKGVNVGGRNLFLKAKNEVGTSFNKGNDINGFKSIWKTFVKNTFSSIDSYPYQSDLLIPRVGQTYTIQMMVRGRLYRDYAYKDYDLSSTNLLNVKTIEYNNSDGIYNSTVSPYDLMSAYSESSPDIWGNLKNGTTHTVGSIERIIYRYQNELYDAYFHVLSANDKRCTCYYVFVGKQTGGYIYQFWYPYVFGNEASDSRTKIKVSENWKLHSHQWTPSSNLDSETQHNMILCRLQTDIGVGTVEIYAPKFELGNIATDWTPAPEDVDEGINNAQSSADKANTNASNAQNTANNAQDTANKANEKADQAKSDADSANTAAQIAKKQADEAQAKSDDANRLANGAVIAISPIAQVVKVDEQGLKILNSENQTSYAQVQSTGLFVFVNNVQRAVFGATSKMENLAVQDYLMFGSHRAETKIEDGEEGTAFFHVGDIK